jgi:hypothetical protein
LGVLMSCWCPINIGRGKVGRSTRGVISCYICYAKCYNKVCVCVGFWVWDCL